MRRLFAVAAVAVALLVGGGPALADPPFRLAEQVTDRAGVLGGAAEVRQAQQRLRDANGIQLFVVYVDSFDGVDGQQWSDRTARLSQLGSDDVLFAVAVRDRAYGYSAPDNLSISERDLHDLMVRRVEPRLAENDWAGAAVTLADGLRGGGGGGFPVGLAVGAVAVVAGGGALLVAARRRQQRRGPSAPPETAGPPKADAAAGVPTEELANRAASVLIAVDDAVETSEQELAFAQAQFGDEAVAGFRAAIDKARAELWEAFTLRQRLDDAQPEDEQTRRVMLSEIIRLCESADKRLDEQAEAFDRLRALERTAPEVLATLTARVEALAGRVRQEEERLGELRRRFAASALTTVTDNAAQASQRLDAAKRELGEARTELDGGRRGEAVLSIRAAEDATGQAATLLDGVAKTEAQLEQATRQIAAARAEILRDVDEARGLMRTANQSDLASLIDRAETAVAEADAAMSPADGALPDPLAALRQLNEAGAALDSGIAAAREAGEKRERTAALLDRALFAANSAVEAAADFIATRRGAVGAEARTRLAEARRQLQEAHARAATDPEAALRQAQYADSLAQQALELARSDVSGWSSPTGPWGRGGGGIDLGSLVLGGILLGGGGGPGQWGGGGRWGGGWSPGSFGGSGTRGRLGGGGRF